MRTYFANLGLFQFLRDYDHSLLVNQPKLWVIRLPYLATYILVANALAFLFILALPLQLYHVQEFFTLLWMVFLACLVALFLWNRQFRQYSPEKAYEDTSPLKGLVDYLIYVACIFAIITPAITTSLTMQYRFSGMITAQELIKDSNKLRQYQYNEPYPDDLVFKYAGFTQAGQRNLDNYEIHSAVDQSIRRLKDITGADFEELQAFSFFYILVIHFGLFMFAGRHVTKRVFNRALVYGVIAFVLYSIYAVVLSILAFSPTFLGRLIQDIDPEIITWPGPLIAFITFMSIMAFSVFRRRERSDFAAMNIVLLPAGVFIYLVYWLLRQADEYSWFGYSQFSYVYWFVLLVSSPLMYVWLIPLLKAMYMRVLALPEK